MKRSRELNKVKSGRSCPFPQLLLMSLSSDSGLATQSSHCHSGTPKILFKGSLSQLGSALVTFPVAMTKYLDKNNLWEKGLIFGSQFAGVVRRSHCGRRCLHSQEKARLSPHVMLSVECLTEEAPRGQPNLYTEAISTTIGSYRIPKTG